MASEIRRVAVLTSGGDAPGMNAAIRAVVRVGVARGYQVFGVRHGFSGLIEGQLRQLDLRDVGGIIDRGGTILGTTRCSQLKTEAGQLAAVGQLRRHQVSDLVVIGGNGSQAGALALARQGLHVIGIASTIDNDLPGSDTTIGATTALDTAIQAIDRLRVTASSHERAFLVEVMGRDSGHLALVAGVAGGAEAILLPEVDTDAEAVASQLRAAYQRGKSHAIVVVAEGARYNADALAGYFREHQARLGFELRVTKLGHIQRGGAPGVFDRIIATELGAAAIDYLSAGSHGILLGIADGKVTSMDLSAVGGSRKILDMRLLDLAQILAR
ncbi:MAG TPA: ATP-dependent 6-phosphofructokinase [Steroidobacteraceae bacterium]|nr:ATP-dependent 6-phosphofructokinase [Steroidobacteraceae bacterium]